MMTSVAATSGNKQSAQATVQFFKTTFEQLSLQKKNFWLSFRSFWATFWEIKGFFLGNLEQHVESPQDATPLTFDWRKTWWWRGEDNTYLRSRQEKRTHENEKNVTFSESETLGNWNFQIKISPLYKHFSYIRKARAVSTKSTHTGISAFQFFDQSVEG